MKTLTSIKIAALTIALTGLTAGAALAGDGHKKDCKKHDKTVMQQDAKTPTAVLSTSSAAEHMASKKHKVIMTYDQAVELCTNKKAANLQACIDKKTGKAKPES